MTQYCMLRLGKTSGGRCVKKPCDKDYKECIHLLKDAKEKDRLFEV